MLKLTALTFALFLTLAIGCTTPDPIMAPDAGQGDLLPIEDYPQIVVTSGLARYLAFSRPIIDDGGGTKPMQVTVPVRLLDELAANTQYRFRFLDAQGRFIQPEEGFKYFRLPAKVQVQFGASALDTNAVDFRLEVRPAR